MNRKIVSILLTSEPNYDEFAFKYFLLSLNRIQNHYEFLFPETHKYYYTNEYYDIDVLFNLFEEKVEPDIKIYSESWPKYWANINIITSPFGENLFFACRGNVAFITTHRWERYFSPPSLFEYLLHCIIGCLLFMENINLFSHRDTRGCCLDYTFFKENNRVDIALGYICDKCKEKITNTIGKEYLAETLQMISREWVGNIDDFGSVAYNLKNFFKFNINKDSGFNKTFLEKVKDHFHEIPKEILIVAISLIMGILFGHYLGK